MTDTAVDVVEIPVVSTIGEVDYVLFSWKTVTVSLLTDSISVGDDSSNENPSEMHSKQLKTVSDLRDLVSRQEQVPKDKFFISLTTTSAPLDDNLDISLLPYVIAPPKAVEETKKTEDESKKSDEANQVIAVNVQVGGSEGDKQIDDMTTNSLEADETGKKEIPPPTGEKPEGEMVKKEGEEGKETKKKEKKPKRTVLEELTQQWLTPPSRPTLYVRTLTLYSELLSCVKEEIDIILAKYLYLTLPIRTRRSTEGQKGGMTVRLHVEVDLINIHRWREGTWSLLETESIHDSDREGERDICILQVHPKGEVLVRDCVVLDLTEWTNAIVSRCPTLFTSSLSLTSTETQSQVIEECALLMEDLFNERYGEEAFEEWWQDCVLSMCSQYYSNTTGVPTETSTMSVSEFYVLDLRDSVEIERGREISCRQGMIELAQSVNFFPAVIAGKVGLMEREKVSEGESEGGTMQSQVIQGKEWIYDTIKPTQLGYALLIDREIVSSTGERYSKKEFVALLLYRYEEHRDSKREITLHIEYIVSNGERGKDYASVLLNYIMEHSKRRNRCYVITVFVEAMPTDAALAFWMKKRGFEVLKKGQIEGYYYPCCKILPG